MVSLAAKAARSRTSKSMSWNGWATPYLFLAPYLVLFGVFVLAPALFGIWVSLHDWDFMLEGRPFVGLDNYTALLDPASAVYADFWMSMRATGIFTLISVPFLVVLPLGIALLLNRPFRGRTFFRGLFFAPYVLGVAVVCLMWRLLLDPNLGLIDSLLGTDIAWTTSLPWAWVALVGVTVWWTIGFNGVIYLAGMQDIPRELYDAAKVDGASRWAEFRHVTLPGLRPVALFVVTTTILASANMFGQSYLLTQGSPGGETRTAIVYMLDVGLKQYKMGSASAMSYVLTLALIVISVLNFRLFRGRS
ncbi:multiple sugar transport system permease protein [Nonomuraea solani]|uniref:Multiple sugar transport system permease protein n=1 Tax=Nonomuraea solani TaxID=1144553 RepID=A0A1H5VQ51_9ACTN|nr:sugar ABC transporter permease [Nonomuraea solani]SEF89354.1 multiple sugar transport system permease protein [Nonomuraea solani]